MLGFSAGGHLAVCAATIFADGKPDAADPIERLSSRPDALVACYPVVTFGHHRHHGSMINLIGEGAAEGVQQSLSLEHRVTEKAPPAFIWHTANDDGVPVENSLLLAAAYSRFKVPFALHVFPKGRHGLGLATEDPVVGQWTMLCASWLREIGFTK